VVDKLKICPQSYSAPFSVKVQKSGDAYHNIRSTCPQKGLSLSFTSDVLYDKYFDDKYVDTTFKELNNAGIKIYDNEDKIDLDEEVVENDVENGNEEFLENTMEDQENNFESEKEPMPSTENDKSLRLLDYLEELTRLRTKTVKDIDSYHKILWLNEIPHSPNHCFTRAWGPMEDIDSDIWIQIKKYDEPLLEDVPEICEDWVNNTKLYDTSSKPELLTSIHIQIEEENSEWTPDDPEEERIRIINRTLELQDHPDVVKEWNQFVDEKWMPWADLHNKWEEVQNVYSKLFSIHQDQLKLGEEYELVLGLGYLRWEPDKGYYAKRHLIVANANLDFDTKVGKFTVNPAIDGAKISLEFDMLEPEDQPAYKIRKNIEEALASANDDPWDKSTIDTVQKSLVNVLGKGQGEFHANGLDIDEDQNRKKPLINFAPALILRRRNTKSLQQVIQSIKDQILNGVSVPDEFIDLSEGKTGKEYTSDEEDESVFDTENKQTIEDHTVYFPLASNERQNEIITKLKSTSGVLVQGPPGTGKSHTIANLICHLLATGKRVLVTAKTPRALRVLHNKLPETVQPLCINLLGSGIDEQKSLESSVINILTNQDQWNEGEANKKIELGQENLYTLKKEKSELEYKIRAERESESVNHSVIEGIYSGTAAKIALKLHKENDLYNWFVDVVPHDLQCPFSIDDLMQIRKNLKNLSPEKKEQLRLELPKEGSDYPDLETFCYLIQEEKRLVEKTACREEILKTGLGQCLSQSDDLGSTQNVIKAILKLNAAVDSISKRPLSWIKKAVYDMLSDKDTPWKDLLTVLENV